MQKAENFIATRVFPVIPVDKQSNIYYTYDKSAWFRDDVQPRADGTESAGTGYGVSTDTYACEVRALHKDIGPQARANTDAPLNLETESAQLLTQKFMLNYELQWVTDYFATSIWDTDVVGGTNFTKWSDYTGSDPIEDVEAGKEVILSTTGFEPNTLVLGYQVFRKLKRHPDIIDLLKYTSSENITAAMLARIFEVDRLFVAKSIKTTDEEGTAESSVTYSFTHGKNALLCYSAPSPGLLTPTAGYTFQWTGVSAGLGTGVGMSREEIPLTRGAVRIEGESAWDGKVVAADMGYFFSLAVA
jgi:hypothetical protein